MKRRKKQEKTGFFEKVRSFWRKHKGVIISAIIAFGLLALLNGLLIGLGFVGWKVAVSISASYCTIAGFAIGFVNSAEQKKIAELKVDLKQKELELKETDEKMKKKYEEKNLNEEKLKEKIEEKEKEIKILKEKIKEKRRSEIKKFNNKKKKKKKSKRKHFPIFDKGQKNINNRKVIEFKRRDIDYYR